MERNCDPNVLLKDKSLPLFLLRIAQDPSFSLRSKWREERIDPLRKGSLLDHALLYCTPGAPAGPAAWHHLCVMWLVTLNTTAVITIKEKRTVGETERTMKRPVPPSAKYSLRPSKNCFYPATDKHQLPPCVPQHSHTWPGTYSFLRPCAGLSLSGSVRK